MGKLTNRQMLEAIYAKVVEKPVTPAMGKPGKPSGGQTEPAPEIHYPEVWSIAPEPGTEDEYPPIVCPPGYHIMYDWRSKSVKLNKDCGPYL